MIIPIITILAIAATAVALRERRANTNAEIRHHYLHSILLGSPQSERYIEELSQLSGSRTKEVVAELLAGLSRFVYRLDPAPLERIASSLHLSEFLLRRAARSRGAERTHYLWLFAQIPAWGVGAQPQIAELAQSEDRMTRFWALMASINADRSSAMRQIAAYDCPMTAFEISQIIAMLRLGVIAVAYQPMLGSASLNLQMLGVAIVRHFGIESAEQELHALVAQSDSPELRSDALYALASMRLSLYTPSIAQFVRHMPAIERRRLLRYLATVGYSQQIVGLLATYHENDYFCSLINSYKIRIRC